MALDIRNAKTGLESHFSSDMGSFGFVRYKNSQYVRVVDGVVLLSDLRVQKSDVYVWASAYPLCQLKIWFGMGVSASRFPGEPGALAIEGFDSVATLIESLQPSATAAMKFLQDRASVEKLAAIIPDDAHPIPKLIQAYCYADIGAVDKARPLVESFLESGIDYHHFREGAESLNAALKSSSVDALLETNRKGNVSRLKLGKLLRTKPGSDSLLSHN